MKPSLIGSLSAMVTTSDRLKEVHKSDLSVGDWMFVKTCNSVYSIRVDSPDVYNVSGGWFDRRGLSPVRTTIPGCTWGGSAIKVDIIAAFGLMLELGDGLITSPIQEFFVLPNGRMN
jgi:hypothetical protein